ncbi:hypothetical protein SLA2020_443990 [Shorea laevis]
MAGGSTQDLQERVAKLEALLSVSVEGSSSSMFEQLVEAQKAISDLQTPLVSMLQTSCNGWKNELKNKRALQLTEWTMCLTTLSLLKTILRAFS